ncbi:hypothetical protein PHJA_002270100 [Phtheirospermum japonicum]|uniref:Uncharacterized protein n=1 Tax=Phtheirospermum japonicum TaxID=374723 RepID=A0A830D4E2_9LAMI|nr:hypothetical protein PHJA_002270100 [Phtheirospermum japonicum]
MARHLSFYSKFRASGPPQDPTVHLIRAMRRLLSRSLEIPKCLWSMLTRRVCLLLCVW